jgi:hypothetical protein
MYLHVFTSNFLSAISNRFLFSSGHLQKTLPRKKKNKQHHKKTGGKGFGGR